MKTIALSERTFNLLQKMKEAKKVNSFESLVIEMIIEKEKVPKSLFGSLKGKAKSFSSKEREELWKNRN
jgi:predicted CopG family antitoxin